MRPCHRSSQPREKALLVRRTLGASNRRSVQRSRSDGVTVKGHFVWHEHADADDFFLVLKGRLVIQMRAGDPSLGAGEIYVVPKGLQHCPRPEGETHLLLIEPSGTPNTGH